ncbi:hypothetical protein AB4851_09675 [Burkholderia sp. 22PA0099]|uniref:hypothetical protein n=1 Tax=Burkholderia sp. 22PA0099 TaxID=3237372 RepID=UPI0039C23C56
MKSNQPAPNVVLFDTARSNENDAVSTTSYVRARSFLVAMTHAFDACSVYEDCDEEVMMLLPDTGVDVRWDGGVISATSRSIVVLPRGRYEIDIPRAGRVIRLHASIPEKLQHLGLDTDADGPALKSNVAGFFRKNGGLSPSVYPLDDYPNSPGMPRAKLFQSAVISINWVEYQGPRDRTQLSPHLHDDIEQGSLALEGDFIHHLRTPWVKDANAWRDDMHEQCSAGSIAVIPPGIVHTTEGIGDVKHVLIDIFSPPRRDFIAKNQILNSSDYLDLKS